VSEADSFKWDTRRTQAAVMLADNSLTDEQIAATIGVTRQALANWKKHPDFQAKVAENVESYRRAVLTSGIADRVKRVLALDDRWQRMKTVIEERADSKEMEHVPGGKTGLLVHQIKAVGRGEDFQLIDLYVVDDGLLSEMRATEKQAAIEAGQWEEKRDITSGGKPLPGMNLLGLSDLSEDELDRRIEASKGRKAQAPVSE
jgi:DNA-binding XRE family transcriptional regulator